jgi:prevent-host-death family protein
MTIFDAIIEVVKERVFSASEFKAKCLACLGEVEQTGESITITRRGRPVAVLASARRPTAKSPRNSWARKARILGDIVNPSAPWEVTSH